MSFKPLLVKWFTGNDEILDSKDDILFGDGAVVTVLGVIEVLGIILISIPLRVIGLLIGGNGVTKVFHIVRGVFLFARVAFPAPTPLGSSALSSAFGRLLT